MHTRLVLLEAKSIEFQYNYCDGIKTMAILLVLVELYIDDYVVNDSKGTVTEVVKRAHAHHDIIYCQPQTFFYTAHELSSST